MSTTVDNRVVKMTFDNKSFEKGVDDTLKTIEKLNKSLEFKDASKGFDNIEQSANSVDFKKLEQNIQTLSDRFSGLGIIGMQIWSRIGDAAYDLITGPFKAVSNAIGSIENQIKTGGWNRALNLDKASNMLKNLGQGWDSVNKAADTTMVTIDGVSKVVENRYKAIDKAVSGTSYSLDEAALASANFLAVNQKMSNSELTDTLRSAMGIASTYSKDFGQIAAKIQKVQAAGHLTQDVVSEFRMQGVAIEPIIKEYLHLEKATEEQMAKIYKNGLISFDQFRDALVWKFGDALDKANETYEGSVANMKAAMSRTGAKFAEPLVASLIPAANEVRQLFNMVNDAISGSGNEVRNITNVLSTAIYKLIDDVDVLFYDVDEKGNRVLSEFGTKFQTALSNIFGGVGYAAHAIFMILDDMVFAFKEVFFSGDFDKTVKKTESFRDKMHSFMTYVITNQNKIIDAFKGFFYVLKPIVILIGTVLKIGFKALGFISKIIIKILGLTGRLITLIAESKVFKTIITNIRKILGKVGNVITKVKNKISDFIKSLKIGDKVIDGVKKTFNFLSEVLKVVWDRGKKAFESIIDGIKKFNDKYKPFETAIGAIKDAFNFVWDAVQKVIDKVSEFTGIQIHLPTLQEVKEKFEELGKKIAWAFNNPKDAANNFLDKLKEVKDYLGSEFSEVVDAINTKFEQFKDWLGKFTGGFDDAKKSMEDFSKSDGLEETEKKVSILERIGDAMDKFAKGLEFVWNTFKTIGKYIVQGFYWAFEQLQDVMDLHDFGDFIRLLKDLATIQLATGFAGQAKGIGEFFGALAGSMKKGLGKDITIFKQIPEAMLKIAAALFIMSASIAALGSLKEDSIKKAESVLGFLTAIAISIKTTFALVEHFLPSDKEADQIFGVIKTGEELKIDEKFANKIVNGLIGKFGTAAELVAAGELIKGIGDAILKMSAALAIVTIAVQDFDGKVNNEAFKKGLESIAASAGILAVGLALILRELKKITYVFADKDAVTALKGGTSVTGILATAVLIGALSGAITVLSVVCAAMGQLNFAKDIIPGIGAIALIVAILTGMFIILGRFTNATGKGANPLKGTQLAGMATAMVGLATSIAIIAGTLHIIKGLSFTEGAGAITALLFIAGIMAGAIWLIGKTGKLNPGTFATIISMAILLKTAVTAISDLSGIIKGEKGADSIIYSCVALVGVIGVLIGLAAVASKIKDTLSVAALIAALGATMLMASYAITNLHNSGANEIGAMVPLLLLVAGLATIMGIFSVAMGSMGSSVFAMIAGGFLAIGAGVFLLAAGVKMLLPLVKDVYDQRDTIRQQLTAVADIIAEVLVGFVVSLVNALADQSIYLINGLGRLILNILIGVVNFLVNNAVTIGEAIGHFFAALVVVIVTALTVFCMDLVAALFAWWGIASPSKKMKQFGEYLIQGLIAGIKAMLSALSKIVGALFDIIIDFVPEPLKWLVKLGKDIVQGLIDGIKNLFGSVTEVAGSLLKLITDPFNLENWKGLGESIMGLFKSGLELMTSPIRTVAEGIVGAVMGPIRSARDELDEFAQQEGTQLFDYLKNNEGLDLAVNQYKKAIQKLSDYRYGLVYTYKEKDANGNLVTKQRDKLLEAEELLSKQSIDQVMRTGTAEQKELVQIYNTYLDNLKAVETMYQNMDKVAKPIFQTMKSEMSQEEYNAVMSYLHKNGYNNQNDEAWIIGNYLGSETIQGLLNGLDQLPQLDSATKKLVDTLKKGLTDADRLAINSPSKYTMWVGRMVMDGLGVGLEEGLPDALDVLGTAVSEIQDVSSDASITPVFDLSEIQNESEKAASAMMDMKTNIPQEVDLLNNTNASKIDYLGESVDGLSSNLSTATLEQIITTQNGLIQALSNKLNDMGVYIDGKTLVGSVITDIDKGLGARIGQIGRSVAR